MPITITEALAEIKTIGKRIDKKIEFMGPFIARPDGVKDPLEKDGGSQAIITREFQAIGDLETRLVTLRRGIQRANDSTDIAINGVSRSIADWLTWRRDIAPTRKGYLGKIRGSLDHLRNEAKKKGITIVPVGQTPTTPQDFVVNISEADLAKQIEQLEDTLGQLDGQLSLKNATVAIVE